MENIPVTIQFIWFILNDSSHQFSSYSSFFYMYKIYLFSTKLMLCLNNLKILQNQYIVNKLVWILILLKAHQLGKVWWKYVIGEFPTWLWQFIHSCIYYLIKFNFQLIHRQMNITPYLQYGSGYWSPFCLQGWFIVTLKITFALGTIYLNNSNSWQANDFIVGRWQSLITGCKWLLIK